MFKSALMCSPSLPYHGGYLREWRRSLQHGLFSHSSAVVEDFVVLLQQEPQTLSMKLSTILHPGIRQDMFIHASTKMSNNGLAFACRVNVLKYSNPTVQLLTNFKHSSNTAHRFWWSLTSDSRSYRFFNVSLVYQWQSRSKTWKQRQSFRA